MDVLTISLASLAAASIASALWVWQRDRRLRRRLDDATAQLESPQHADPVDTLVRAAERERALRLRTEDAAAVLQESVGLAEFGLLVVDRAGNTVFANEFARRFLGARHGDAVAETEIRELLAEVGSHVEERTREVELYTPSHRHLGLRAVPLFRDQGPSGVVLYIEDQSERRLIDTMRREFVANASHELKTPLGALRVLVETLVDTQDIETQERLSRRLLDETTRMSRIVDDILSLAVIEGEATSFEPLRVNELLAEAHGEVALLAKQHGIPVEVASAEGDPVVGGDRTQLLSALSNLLENAIKYTAVGGNGNDQQVRVSAVASGASAIIEVSDRGIGIPEAHLDRVFERFYRVDRGRSRQTGGTGLGLAIVRHVVMNHSGTVSARSTPGSGSTFTVTLPRWRA